MRESQNWRKRVVNFGGYEIYRMFNDLSFKVVNTFLMHRMLETETIPLHAFIYFFANCYDFLWITPLKMHGAALVMSISSNTFNL